MKKVIILSLKVILLITIMFISMAVSSILIGVKHVSESSVNTVIPVLI